MHPGKMRVYIGLGSNLNNPMEQLQRGLCALARLPQSSLQQISRFYKNPPMGPQDQPDFINAVVAMDTGLSPLALLMQLQGIEDEQGRQRHRHWGERNLDLDILLYGRCQFETKNLSIPHPGLLQRDFVFLLLLEIAPQLCLPSGAYLINDSKQG